MDKGTLMAILIPSVLSVAVTAGNVLHNVLKDKRRSKEKAWDLAEKLTLSIQENHVFMNGDTVLNRVLCFNLAYRAALLVSENKEEEFLKLCQQFPSVKLFLQDYVPHPLTESPSEDSSPK